MAIQKIPNTLIADNAITATKIANGTLTADDIAANSITAAKLSASTSPTFGGLTTTGDINFGDNDKAVFGAGSDLQIYSDGTHSRIYESGSGLLIIRAGNFNINNADGSQSYMTMSDGGAATLYYAGSAKIATTSSGIDVTGTAVTDGLTATGVIVTEGDAAVNDAQIGRLNFTNTNSNASSNPIRASILAGRQNSAWGGYLSLYTSTGTDAASEKVRIGETGNVGIGATPKAYHSDYKAIDINNSAAVMGYTGNNGAWLMENLYYGTDNNWKHKNSDFSALVEMYDGVFNFYNTASGTAGATATLQNRLKIDTSGNVGIGVSPANKLEIQHGTIGTGNGSNNTLALRYNSTTLYGQHYMDANGLYHIRADAQGVSGGNLILGGDASVQIWTGSTPESRVVVDSSGRLLVGNTGLTGCKMSIYNSGVDALRIALSDNSASSTSLIACFSDSTTTAYGTLRLNIVASGNVTNSNNSYGGISDEKLKENIVDATDKLEDLKQVRIRNYNFIGEDKKQIGVIAQELETIFPNMVEETPDLDNDNNDLGTTTKSVKYSVFVPMLVKAIQEQQTQIDALQSEINLLKGE